MTITQTTPEPGRTDTFRLFVVDLYRDIHKGIRAELFSLTEEAGRLDPADGADRAAVAAHVRQTVDFLVQHAEHEDTGIQPALEAHLPSLAERVAEEHEALEVRMAGLVELAGAAEVASPGEHARAVHHLYLELATFASVYLAHQDVEERVVMPALEDAVGVDAVGAINGAIIGAIPPPEMARSLAIMLPAMNVDGRAELLGGMRAAAPAEVFEGVWSLTGSVLRPADLEALAARLDLA